MDMENPHLRRNQQRGHTKNSSACSTLERIKCHIVTDEYVDRTIGYLPQRPRRKVSTEKPGIEHDQIPS